LTEGLGLDKFGQGPGYRLNLRIITTWGLTIAPGQVPNHYHHNNFRYHSTATTPASPQTTASQSGQLQLNPAKISQTQRPNQKKVSFLTLLFCCLRVTIYSYPVNKKIFFKLTSLHNNAFFNFRTTDYIFLQFSAV